MQDFYDISRPLHEGMSVYKNRPSKAFLRRIDAQFPDQTLCESTVVQWNLHTGTHVDAPAHMLPEGRTLEQLPLAPYVGLAQVVSCLNVEERIEREDLEGLALRARRLLLRTRNSEREEYDSRFVYLSAEAAAWLVEQGVELIGIDAMSVERDQPEHPAHEILLASNVAILEDIRLSAVPDGLYTLLALPLALRGAEASPVRALLLPKDWTPQQPIPL